MEYLDLQTCVEEVFPFIHALLTKKEPAPVYAREQNGMQELEKVLTFVRDDCFYLSPTLTHSFFTTLQSPLVIANSGVARILRHYEKKSLRSSRIFINDKNIML
ncbi:hypothetical protein HYS30_01160 [Candidatus Peregrinibacteria bacterium]|nr:hypothetical protein [Candidatus Peregrinibacteria bacterium]MBI2524026.1 hypothetical protein [Candidatus Peregrinibacteria bacterium]